MAETDQALRESEAGMRPPALRRLESSAMTPDQRRKLLDYASREDRKPEPVFAGREAFFDVVAKNVRSAKSRIAGDPEGPGDSTGTTVCLTGPPGAGKSAFVQALKKRKDFDGFTAWVVEIPRSDLHHPGCVLATVAGAIKDFEFDEKLRGRLTGFGIGLSAAGTGGRMSLSWNPKAPPPFSSFPVELFAEGAKKLLARGDAFILVIDEAQGIDPSPGSKANGLLAHLHQGVPLPIVPVLAGQPNTQERLRETISGSRYADGNEPFMTGLKDGEARGYVLAMLDWLEIEGMPAQREALAQWIAAECGGWPHHLSNAMKAVAEGLLEASSMRLRAIDGEVVAASLTARRLRYYQSRLSSQAEIEACEGAVLQVLGQMDGARAPLERRQLNAALRKALKAHSPERDVAALELRHALSMSGLLARNEKTGQGGKKTGEIEWICPIPSIAHYMETGKHQPEAPFPEIGLESEALIDGR